MQLVCFLLFTLGVLALTMYLTRKDDHDTSDGYFLGGRSLSAGVICGSLLLTNLSTEQIIGLTGGAYSAGLVVMAWEVLSAVSIVFLAVYFLPKFLNRGITTAPEFLEARFDKDVRFYVSILFLFGYAGIFLPVVLFTGATALDGIFDLQTSLNLSEAGAVWLLVWALGLIGSIYAIYGGLKAVAVSDTFNGIGLLIGGLIIPYVGLKMCGDGSVMNGLKVLAESHPEKFTVKGDAASELPWQTIFTGLFVITTFYWCTNQAIIQRALGAKSLKEGQKGVLYCALIKVFVPIIVVLPGIIALHLYSGDLGAKGDGAYPLLVRNLLPPWMSGFFAAVMFGAILSSFNSALNSAGTLFALDIYKVKINPEADEKQQVKVGRNFSIGMAIVAMLTAPLLMSAKGIFNYLQMCNTIYMVPIFSLFIAGFFSNRVTAKMAKAGLFSALALNIIFTILENTGAVNVHWLHRAGGVFVFSLALMFAFRGEEKKLEPKVPENYDITPWPHANKVGIGILVVILAIYASLWK
ncbi:MAG: solute:sodium symporter family transporter [Lentisphaeraceae bacterium]|nr:solute:sodium symporter family transporter [Lentisphaeraceae bacterium]